MRTRLHISLSALAGLALTVTSVAAQTVAITGGKVYTVSGAPIDNGTVLIRDGRIVQVGANVAIPADAQRVDATGKWVTPGLINSATQLGIVEVALEQQTRDMSANGHDAIAASFTVWDGFNPSSPMLAPGRRDGITTVMVAPSGGLIAGQAAALDLVDGSTSDMLARAPVAMIAQVGNPRSANTGARGELLNRLREVLDDARAYSRRRADFERNATRPFAATRADLEALIPVVEGRMPIIVDADRSSDIEGALKLAQDYGLKLVISSGAEAWKVADKLAAAHVPVLTGAMNNIPSSFATLGQRQENAALLRRAGVDVVLIGNAGGGDEEAFNARNIKQEAGNAIAYGMSWDDALRAVTLDAARVLGMSDRYGSLDAGKVANVVVWSGDPFEFGTRAEHVWVRGREYPALNRQEMLEQRYKTLPPNYRTPSP
jgi:imidazolonepropionase-like amidohydrolase